jgi:uncharacterized membrane protein
VIFGLSFYQLSCYVVWFFAYSFAGWCFEGLYCLVFERALVNRGFLRGPVLPIYGVGALLAVIVLQPNWNIAVQFLVSALAAGVLEYGTSWAMEKLFHARWWDYSDRPLNINGRVFPLGLATFGVLMVAVYRLVQPWLERLCDLIPPDILELVAVLLLAVLVMDLTASAIHARGLAHKLEAVQERLAAAADAAHAAMTEVVADVRCAMSEASTDMREAMGEAGSNVRGAVEGAGSGTPVVTGEQRTQIAERLHDLADHAGIASYERKAARNPFYKPVRAGEAADLMRSRVKERRATDRARKRAGKVR